MRYFKLILEYDGTDFSGWQIQPHCRTVQGVLYRALRELCTGNVKIIGAGRTDAGAHAAGQVAGVEMETDYSIEVLGRALRAKLPGDVLIKTFSEVDSTFNARFDAKSRTYRYIFKKGGTALWRRRFYPIGSGVDVGKMRFGAQKFLGQKNFEAFSSASEGVVNGICRVMKSEIIEINPLVIYEITADHFLYNMVRRISGTLLSLSEGDQIDIGEILESGDRSRSHCILPAYALYLVEVCY